MEASDKRLYDRAQPWGADYVVFINLHGSCDERSLPNLVSQLAGLDDEFSRTGASDIGLDLSQLTFIEPLPLSMITAWLKTRERSGATIQVARRPPGNASRYDVDRYLETVGFYDLFGQRGEGRLTSNRGARWMLAVLCSERDTFTTVNALIERIKRNSALNDVAANALNTAFSEVIENVFDHAGCDLCVVCLQVYVRNRTVALAVSDCGRGFRRSLAQNPSLCLPSSDYAAIEFALQKRVTAGTGRNTGMGLFVVHQLVKQNQGSMCILSHQGYWTSRGRDESLQPVVFPGTVVGVRFNLARYLNTREIYVRYWNLDEDKDRFP